MTLAPTPKSLRFIRMLRVALHLTWGLFVASVLFRLTPVAQHNRLSQRWSKKMLAIFGVEVQLHGDMPNLDTRGIIIVSNHMSWLDIWLIYSIRPVRFISKADVRDWPVIGWLAQQSGTLFIRRDQRRHTAAINRQAAELLAQGDCIGLFPEGTTTDGLSMLPLSFFFVSSRCYPPSAGGVTYYSLSITRWQHRYRTGLLWRADTARFVSRRISAAAYSRKSNLHRHPRHAR